jgi:hypothetical protein
VFLVVVFGGEADIHQWRRAAVMLIMDFLDMVAQFVFNIYNKYLKI